MERRALAGRYRAVGGLLLLLLAAARADAQPPEWRSPASVPLPGPAPSAVAAHPAPLLGSLPGATASSPWDTLREAEAELQRREEDLQRCRTRLGTVTEDLRLTQEHLRQLESGMQVLRAEVLRRMVLLDRVGRGGAARLVLTSRDPAEARFRSSLVRRLVRADAEIADRYAAMKTEAETIRTDLAGKLGSQQALERQLEERRRQLADEVERHRRLLSTLRRPEAVAALAGAARGEVDGLALALELPTVERNAVALQQIVEAAIAVPASFPTTDDVVQRGLAIDAPAGTPVAAPAPGTVAFAGLLAGYGPAVLLRTQDGAGVLLGHLADVAVRIGDVVAPGTVLGRTERSYSDLFPPLLVDVVGAPVHES